MTYQVVVTECKQLGQDIFRVYLTLLKIMIPVLVLIKALSMLGAIEYLAKLLSPIMALVGLPDAMGLVWATTMSTNIYAGMLVFYELLGSHTLSVAQISTLGVMMLVAHSLPVEVAVTKKAGLRLRFSLALRVGCALLIGVLLHGFYQYTGFSQQASVVLWRPDIVDQSLSAWLFEQLKSCVMILFVIASLMSLLKLLRLLGVERLIYVLMSPLLRLLKIGDKAANTAIIGLTLGLSFGGALLINEAKSGHLTQRDICMSLCFLSLCHSVIEDSLLIMLLGADIYVVLWLRLLFTLLIMTVLARMIYRDEQHIARRWFMTARQG